MTIKILIVAAIKFQLFKNIVNKLLSVWLCRDSIRHKPNVTNTNVTLHDKSVFLLFNFAPSRFTVMLCVHILISSASPINFYLNKSELHTSQRCIWHEVRTRSMKSPRFVFPRKLNGKNWLLLAFSQWMFFYSRVAQTN